MYHGEEGAEAHVLYKWLGSDIVPASQFTRGPSVWTRKKLSPSFAILIMCIGCADNTPTMTSDSHVFDAMPNSGTNRPDTAARSSDSGG